VEFEEECDQLPADPQETTYSADPCGERGRPHGQEHEKGVVDQTARGNEEVRHGKMPQLSWQQSVPVAWTRVPEVEKNPTARPNRKCGTENRRNTADGFKLPRRTAG